STLYAVEAMRFARDLDINHPGRRHAEEVLRKALANISGEGLHADIGAITHVAAHDRDTKDHRTELEWLAAAGSNGEIALWDLRDAENPQVKILPSGYAPPFRSLAILGDGRYLVAENYRHNVTVWDLRKPKRPCYVIETLLSDEPVSFPVEQPRVYA